MLWVRASPRQNQQIEIYFQHHLLMPNFHSAHLPIKNPRCLFRLSIVLGLRFLSFPIKICSPERMWSKFSHSGTPMISNVDWMLKSSFMSGPHPRSTESEFLTIVLWLQYLKKKKKRKSLQVILTCSWGWESLYIHRKAYYITLPSRDFSILCQIEISQVGQETDAE